MRDPNYVVGRGKLYFNKFLPGTKTLSGGSRYLGNSPELSLSQDEDKLDHYNSDGGIKVKDASVSLQNDETGSFNLDDISPENLALWFRGAVQNNVIAGGAVVGEAHAGVALGTYIQLGLTPGNPIGARNVSLVTAAKAGTAATGTVTFSTAPPVDTDSVTVGGVAYTFKAAPAGPNDVALGATIAEAAANLAAAINADTGANAFYATVAGAIVTIHADATGVGGNAITLAKAAATPANITVSGATLAGGGAGGTTAVPEAGNFEVDAVTGRVLVLADAESIAEGDDLTFGYTAAAGTEEVVIAAGTVIEGRLEFFAANAAGENRDYLWPYVQIRPDGDFALKGDDWQNMTFSLEVLKLNDSTERQYIVKR
jgi:hypothetical protein